MGKMGGDGFQPGKPIKPAKQSGGGAYNPGTGVLYPQGLTEQGSQDYYGYHYANTPGVYDSASLQQSQPTGAPSGSGGGGGSGRHGSSGHAAALSALQGLFDYYQGVHPNQGHLDLLNTFIDQAHQTGATAIDQLRQALTAQQSTPYQQLQLTPAVQATNPLQEYMHQSGAGTGLVDSMVNMLNGQNQTNQTNAHTLQTNLGQSDQTARQGRLNDVQYADTSFQQSLANQKLVGQQRESDLAQQKKDAIMQQIIQYALSKNINLGAAGIKF